jgi:predicted nuclease of predicted toxin-antitoxin system
MKFLCDVHISYSLVNYLKSSGFDAVHVNELPDKWFSTDKFICSYADESDRIVITKDSDFKNSFFIQGTPSKLIKVNLGNIANNALISIFSKHLRQIEELNLSPRFIVEVDSEKLFYTRFDSKN